MLLNHFSELSMIRKRITTSLTKLWGYSKKISQSSSINIKQLIIDRLKLQKKHKNYLEPLKLPKLLMNLKKLLIKTYCLRQKSFKKKLSIWIKKWKMNFEQQNKRFNQSSKNIIWTFNKIGQWTKRQRIQYRTYRRYYNKIWIKF